MAIKDDLEYIKEGLNTQEQLLSSAIASERFFKKYKKIIYLGVILALVFVLIYGLNSFFQNKNIKENNALYNALMLDVNNSALAAKLNKASPNLYALYALQMAKNGELAPLNLALENPKSDAILKEILKAASGDGSELLADYDALLTGFKLLKENNIQAAKLEFAKITENSSLKQLARNLEHYQGIK